MKSFLAFFLLVPLLAFADGKKASELPAWPGTVPDTQTLLVVSNDTYYTLPSGQLRSSFQIRKSLTNSLTFFVATNGDNSNDGLTQSTPLLSIQSAVDKALLYDFSTNNITIQLADGAYSGSVLAAQQIGAADWKAVRGLLILHGNDNSPGSVVITNATTNHLITASQGTHMLVSCLTVGSTNIPGANLLEAQLWSSLAVSNIYIGPSGSDASQITSESFGHFFTKGPYVINGGGGISHLQAISSGDIWITKACTISNTPVYSTAFAQAYANGIILFDGGSFTGSATCSRFYLRRGGVLNTFGAFSADTLPGDSNGTQGIFPAELSGQPISIGNYFIGTNGPIGVTDASEPMAGVVGEFTNKLLASASAQSVSNNVSTNVLSFTLSPGEWAIDGHVNFAGASATATRLQAAISTTANTMPIDGSQTYNAQTQTTSSFTTSVAVSRQRINVTTSTTVFLVAQALFSAGTVTAYGQMSALRIR